MASVATPEVLWAQRSSATDPEKNFVYLTISVPDVPPKSLKLDLQPTGVSFEGHSDTLHKSFAIALDLYAEIDPAESKVHHTPKNVELRLRKKELKAEYWPRLLKEAKKAHFLKTDFDKWVDEDEQDEAAEDDFGQFGGGMGGMPGMGGPGMGGDFGGIDFSKLGGAGAGADDDDEEEEDEDMPPLEGEEEEDEAAAKGGDEPASSKTEGKKPA